MYKPMTQSEYLNTTLKLYMEVEPNLDKYCKNNEMTCKIPFDENFNILEKKTNNNFNIYKMMIDLQPILQINH
jgi:hypothetical protein